MTRETILLLLSGYMYLHPGKKLLFMGDEFGKWSEWYHEKGLQWNLLERPMHRGHNRWVKDLNRLLKKEPSLYERDFEPGGFEWIDSGDSEKCVISFLRKG